jgi:MOSC domain-containing protein YiiM
VAAGSIRQTRVVHRTLEELTAGVEHLAGAPSDGGTLDLIVSRPAVGERILPIEAQLDLTAGLVGDTWNVRPSRSSADGGPHPDKQVTVMNVRAALLVAGTLERVPLAGDQLYVDLDVSFTNLSPGTRLTIGTAVLEVTDSPHTGCAHFAERFGTEALRFVNTGVGKALRMRGINTRVVTAGTARIGDVVKKG